MDHFLIVEHYMCTWLSGESDMVKFKPFFFDNFLQRLTIRFELL